jgi:hypothetical protein
MDGVDLAIGGARAVVTNLPIYLIVVYNIVDAQYHNSSAIALERMEGKGMQCSLMWFLF